MAERKKKTQNDTGKPVRKPSTSKKAKKRGRPRKKGKNLTGASQWNNVRLRLVQFYDTRGISVTPDEIREYTSKLYQYLKTNSRAYKNGNVRILKKTLDETFRGDVRTHDIFAKMGLPYPGADKGNDEFYYWDLSSELMQYDQKHDRITIDLRIMGDFGNGVLRYPTAFDALMEADHPIVNGINEWVKFVTGGVREEDDYYVFRRKSVGENDWYFKLEHRSGALQTDTAPEKPAHADTVSDAEAAERTREAKGRADEAEQKAGKAKVEKLSAMIESNNAQIKSFKEQRKSSQSIINEVLDTIAKKKKVRMKVDREMGQIERLEKEVDELEFLEEVLRKENEELKKQISELK